MTEELSIKNIKKKIVDRLINNLEILKYLEAERIINEGYTIPKLYNALIYDYDIGNVGNFISVEVAESDSPTRTAMGDMKYTVVIKMSLEDERKICDMSSIVADIVNELYPSRKRFSNVAYRVIENNISAENYGVGYSPVFCQTILNNRRDERLHRMITFEI